MPAPSSRSSPASTAIRSRRAPSWILTGPGTLMRRSRLDGVLIGGADEQAAEEAAHVRRQQAHVAHDAAGEPGEHLPVVLVDQHAAPVAGRAGRVWLGRDAVDVVVGKLGCA